MKTHPLNVSYLVVGLALLGIAGSWALRQAGVIDAGSVDWLIPLTLVIAGGIGLVAFVAKSLRRSRTDASPTGTSYDEELGYDDTTTLFETDTDTRTDQGETR
jgi:hypothetical protein